MRASRGVTAAAIVLAFTIPCAAQSAESARTIWEGVYSADQAARGQNEYATHCASCHKDDLSGFNDLLRGPRFMDKYREASLHRLFDKIQTTMPPRAAGTLSDRLYVDIVTYLLQVNEFPAGSEELSAERLADIQLVGRGGPEPVPDFALVQVVGCLGQNDADGSWRLTNTTEPVRAGGPQPTDSDRTASAGQRLGAGTFRLLVSAAYTPGPHKGHKVEVRGFLIRRPVENRINITSIETLASACSE